MEILLIMCVGIVVGAKLFPAKGKAANEKVQIVCTMLLIFSMGISLGRRENLLEQLSQIGLTSFALAVGPIIGSVIAVYFLTQWLMKPTKRRKR